MARTVELSISLGRLVVNEMPGKRILLASALEKALSETLNDQGNHGHKMLDLA